jgi:hypothetical protein
MMSEASKLSLNGNNKITVEFVGILWLISKAKVDILSANARLCLPLLVRLGPRYAFVSRCVAFIFTAIRLIVSTLAWTEILFSVVQRITVSMVGFWKFAWNQLAMHEYHPSTFSHRSEAGRVKYICLSDACSVPVPLRKAHVILNVNNGKHTARERNMANGLVVRLRDKWTEFSVLSHVFDGI